MDKTSENLAIIFIVIFLLALIVSSVSFVFMKMFPGNKNIKNIYDVSIAILTIYIIVCGSYGFMLSK